MAENQREVRVCATLNILSVTEDSITITLATSDVTGMCMSACMRVCMYVQMLAVSPCSHAAKNGTDYIGVSSD